MSLSFKDWLQEEESMTSTGSIATVPIRWGPGGDDIVRRKWPKEADDDEDKKKKKKHKKDD